MQFGPDDVDAEAEEVVNELQLLTEDMSNKENEQNDWSMLFFYRYINIHNLLIIIYYYFFFRNFKQRCVQ